MTEPPAAGSAQDASRLLVASVELVTTMAHDRCARRDSPLPTAVSRLRPIHRGQCARAISCSRASRRPPRPPSRTVHRCRATAWTLDTKTSRARPRAQFSRPAALSPAGAHPIHASRCRSQWPCSSWQPGIGRDGALPAGALPASPSRPPNALAGSSLGSGEPIQQSSAPRWRASIRRACARDCERVCTPRAPSALSSARTPSRVTADRAPRARRSPPATARPAARR